MLMICNEISHAISGQYFPDDVSGFIAQIIWKKRLLGMISFVTVKEAHDNVIFNGRNG